MTVLVIGSVIGYSVILPQRAPKQITLAVLPFYENDSATSLSLGFSSALRDSLALSRDVVVVDTISSMSVVWDERTSNEIVSMLALTHVVNGELSSSENNGTNVHYRVLNVSQPTWKEVISRDSTLNDNSDRPWQELRDEMTVDIRQSLYDNNSMMTESRLHQTDLYVEHLQRLGVHLKALEHAWRGELWIDRFQEHYERYLSTTEMSSDVYFVAQKVREQLRQSGDLAAYGEALWLLVDDHPNSFALELLAELAYEVQSFAAAERLWLRVARMKPQSTYVALRIADARRRQSDYEGVQKALRIAGLRSNESAIVDYYRSVFDHASGQNVELAEVDTKSAHRTWTHFIGKLGISRVSDLALDLAIHLRAEETPSDIPSLRGRLWLEPPPFMDKGDQRWNIFKQHIDIDMRYEDLSKGYDILPALQSEEALLGLFTPRRPD